MAFYVARVDSEGRELDRAYLSNSQIDGSHGSSNGSGSGSGSGSLIGNCAGIRIRYRTPLPPTTSCVGVIHERLPLSEAYNAHSSSADLLSTSFSSDSVVSEESYNSVSVVRPKVPPLCNYECNQSDDSPVRLNTQTARLTATQRSNMSRMSTYSRPSISSLRTHSGSQNDKHGRDMRVVQQACNKPKLTYESWLSAKNKQIAKDHALRKAIEERNQADMEKRKMLATRKYEEWLAAKEATTTTNEEQPQEQQQQLQQQQHYHLRTHSAGSMRMTTANKTVADLGRRERTHLPPEEMQRRLIAWENRKIAELERKRLQRRLEEQRKREDDVRRKEANERAWRIWEAAAAEKPKPVPLNCGMLSLRGTISAIYVNPNEWRSIIDNNNNNSNDANGGNGDDGCGNGNGNGEVKPKKIMPKATRKKITLC